MNGKQFRLERFLRRSNRPDGDEGKLVVAAVDHGAFHGPIAGLEDIRRACSQLTEADGVLMAQGSIRHVADLFTHPGAPCLLTRLAWNSSYGSQWGYRQAHHRRLSTVADAVRKGADVVLASLALHTGNEEVDARNVGLFSDLVQEAERLGVPIVGEYFPAAAGEMSSEELHQDIRIGCRVIAELGADVIKTFYTGERFSEVVASTPVPILVLGAEKTPTEREALMLASRATQAGARGIVFGRNVVQSVSPSGFIRAVRSVMVDKTDVNDAIRTHGLAKA